MKYNATLTNWFSSLSSAITAGSFVKLAVTKPTADAGDLKSVDVRLITVKRELKLSFTYHHKTRDIVKNYSPQESEAVLATLLAKSFTIAKIFTLEADVLILKKGKDYEVTHHGATQTKVPDLTHDKSKNRLIAAEAKSWLHALGVTDAQGNVLAAAQDKYRQINKYTEILDGLIKQLPKQDKPLRIVDMGSGKGYLTFALYDHLTTTMGLQAQVTGVEFRPELVKLCNDIARQNAFTGLNFQQGSIADHDTTGTDIVIALHACDTATDDALNKAIRASTKLIVVAPCCHKQIRREMKNTPANHPLNFLLTYGTYAERMAEMLTDGLRAKLLEISGYTTNLFEFISGDHTPKNVMIVATKQTTQPTQETLTKLRAEFAAAKAQFNIKTHQLEHLLSL